MADGFGIAGTTPGVAAPVSPASSQAADAAANLPGVKVPDTAPVSTQGVTSFTAEPAIPAIESKVVARLFQQNATPYAPGLARVPLPPRPEDVPRTTPKKPAGPMVQPRALEGGRSPLAPTALFDARASTDGLGELPVAGPDAGAFWSGRLDALEQFLGGAA